MKWLPSAFRHRLAMAMGLMALLMGLCTYQYIGAVYGKQFVHDREQALFHLAYGTAAGLSHNLGERLRDIGALGQLMRGQVGSGLLGELQRNDPAYAWIGVADAQGRVIAATGDMLLGRQVADRPWFGGGQRGPYVGDRHQAQLLQTLLAPAGAEPMYFIDIAMPLHLSDRPGTAVLAAHVYWRWAAEVVQGIVPRQTARELIDVFLVNAQGQILYPDRGAGQSQLPAGVVPGARHTVVLWGDGQRYLTQAVAVPEAWPATPLGWRVVVRQPVDVALAELRDLQRVTIWGTLAAAAVFLVLAWWGARYISRPLEALARQARRIAAGDETAALRVQGGGADILRLSDAVAAMAQTLIARKNALEQNNQQLEHKVAERTAELALANQALQQLARLDALTGLPNRLAAEERLAQEFTRFKRAGQPYSVVVLDIDHFKSVNDTWGHATGDQVLRHVAGVLRASLRASDFIGRTGGEEFLLLLPETPLPAALEVADKVRAALHAQPEATAGLLSLSAGVSEVQLAHLDADVAVRQADQALYRAKRAGRNRVEASSHADPAGGDQPR